MLIYFLFSNFQATLAWLKVIQGRSHLRTKGETPFCSAKNHLLLLPNPTRAWNSRNLSVPQNLSRLVTKKLETIWRVVQLRSKSRPLPWPSHPHHWRWDFFYCLNSLFFETAIHFGLSDFMLNINFSTSDLMEAGRGQKRHEEFDFLKKMFNKSCSTDSKPLSRSNQIWATTSG